MKCRAIAGVSIPIAVLLICTFPSATSAQNDTAAVRAMYQTSATVPTNLPGVRRFPDPPVGFDPVSASDIELASYGFLPRPDAQADPNGYARWSRAMKMAKNHWTGDLKETEKYHLPNREAKVVAARSFRNDGRSQLRHFAKLERRHTHEHAYEIQHDEFLLLNRIIFQRTFCSTSIYRQWKHLRRAGR